jgi:MazG family protein
MKPYILEECHELLEAIEKGDPRAQVDEIGDLLLHCAFLTVLGEEEGLFTSAEIFERLEEKIRRRHPHLFTYHTNGEDVEKWETIKGRERKKEGRNSLLDGIPSSLPPLLKSFRLQERAAGWKFDWSSPDGALEKVSEEVNEITKAYRSGDRGGIEEEIGDLLFAVVNLSRLLDVHPDEALSHTIRKFTSRFDLLSERAAAKGLVLGEASLEELDEIWEAIKREERNPETKSGG